MPMKSSIVLTLSLSALLCLSCSKKQETPAPQQNAPEAAPQAAEQANPENAPAQETAKTGKIQCGNYTYDADSYKDWICLNGVLRCLKKDGCKYKDKIAPIRTLVAGEDELLFCDDSEAPEDVKGLRCLDETLERFYSGAVENRRLHVYDEQDPDEYVKHVAKNRYLVCTQDSCDDLEKGEQSAPIGNGFTMHIGVCEPTRMLPETTCKNGVMYCGDAAYPGVGNDYFSSSGSPVESWRCVQNKWLCVDPACQCAGEKHTAGKFGTCKDGIAYCGDKEMDSLTVWKPLKYRGEDYDKGYICQTGKWVCANPEGCGKCGQYQSLSDKGTCEGKSVKPNIKLVACKEGNCPCGDGACPKDGACLTVPGKPPMCVCGKYHETQYCYDRNEYPVVSNEFGEFTCEKHHVSGSSGGGDFYWDVSCDNPKGCHIKGHAEVWKSPVPEDDDSWEWWEDKLTIPTRYTSNHKLDAYDQAFLDLEYSKCGRSTALEFKKTCAGEKCGYDSKEECEIRKTCDTQPVPRDARKNFSCDYAHHPAGPYRCYSWLSFDWTPVGLRCNADTGCTCNQETCAKGQLCVNGVCHYDTIYAQQHCQNVYPHLAPDEPSFTLEDEGGGPRPEWDIIGEDSAPGLGKVHVFSPSDPNYDKFGDIANEVDPEVDYWADTYKIHDKVFYWDQYSDHVESKLVTINGTCICGYSEVTPKKLSDYKCVQTLGYVCLNAQGCACGNAQCQKGALCLRDGLCSSVVMDKGVAPEKITNDVEDWCNKKRQEDEFN